MKQLCTSLILLLFILFNVYGETAQNESYVSQQESNDSEKEVYFQVYPSLGLTYSSSKYEGDKYSDLQWLGTIDLSLDYINPKYHLSTYIFAQYGESKIKGEDSEILSDLLIVSVTPSIPVIKKPAIRLFLETTAETSFGKGMIDDRQTKFMDPVFLYQTLFLGQKHYSYEKNEKVNWELTYGLGYAFQETINKDFQIEDNIQGTDPDFESGFSGIIEFNLDSQITDDISWVLKSKAVALSRKNLFSDFDSSRRSILIRSGFFYKWIGLEYNYHLVHDLNYSTMNMIDQSLMLTFGF